MILWHSRGHSLEKLAEMTAKSKHIQQVQKSI